MHLIRPDLLGHIIEELPEVIGTPAANASEQRRAIGLHRMAQELCHEIAAPHLQLLVLGPGSKGHNFFHLLDLGEPSISQPACKKREYIKLTPAGVGDAIKFVLSRRLIESPTDIMTKKKDIQANAWSSNLRGMYHRHSKSEHELLILLSGHRVLVV